VGPFYLLCDEMPYYEMPLFPYLFNYDPCKITNFSLFLFVCFFISSAYLECTVS